jgi:general secretion pathway protein I
MTRPVSTRYDAGFTLLEILVALAVLALSLGALIGATSNQARNTAFLVDRTLAQWVAANAVADHRLEGRWDAPGSRRGRSTLGDREWHWTAVTAATDDPDLRRLEVAVRRSAEADAPLVTLVAYVDRPPGSGR